MAPISIDIDIASTIQAVDGILAHREGERITIWELLEHQLQAVSLTVGNLDRMYYRLLAEVEHIFEQQQLSLDRIADVIDQASAYCNDERLLLRLVEWRGMIQSAAFNHALDQRRYRDLASLLRSIDDPMERYIERLYRLQDENTKDIREFLRRMQTTNTPEVPTHNQRWDLRAVLELLKLVITHLTEYGQIGEDLPNPGDACEEAVRNFDRALALVLVQLIGRAREDIAMERL